MEGAVLEVRKSHVTIALERKVRSVGFGVQAVMGVRRAGKEAHLLAIGQWGALFSWLTHSLHPLFSQDSERLEAQTVLRSNSAGGPRAPLWRIDQSAQETTASRQRDAIARLGLWAEPQARGLPAPGEALVRCVLGLVEGS